MLVLMITLSLLGILAGCLGIYFLPGWIVRNRPDSPAGKWLRQFPYYATQATSQRKIVEAKMEAVRETVAVVQTADTKIATFRDLKKGDEAVVLMPDGQKLTLTVAGTANTIELIQRDDRNENDPWVSTGDQLVFQVFDGAQRIWIFECPNGTLAMVTAIHEVDDGVVNEFGKAALAFGDSGQNATDITVQWAGKTHYLFDIGRLAVYQSEGKIVWRAARRDYGDGAWPDTCQQIFLLAGPAGGKNAQQSTGDQLLVVTTPASANGGLVLEAVTIDTAFFVDLRKAG